MQRMAGDSCCPIKFVLCGQITLLLMELLFEPREVDLFACDRGVRIIQGFGKEYSCGVKVDEVLCMLLGRGHAGWMHRGHAGGIKDTCKGCRTANLINKTRYEDYEGQHMYITVNSCISILYSAISYI